MYGIFIDKELGGIIIIDYNKDFKIDEETHKIKTFYIQEIIIHKKFRRLGYAELLIHYIILRCPIDRLYISFMTTPYNTGMIKIAKKYDFIQQITSSGDKKHNLLFIKKNDKLDIKFNNIFVTASLSSSSKS